MIQVESYDIELSKDPIVAKVRVEVLAEFVNKLKSEDREV